MRNQKSFMPSRSIHHPQPPPPQAPATLLLWDIDGTLLRTSGAGMRAMKNVGARMFGQHAIWDGIESAGSLDPVIYQNFAKLNALPDGAEHHEKFRDTYLAELALEIEASRAQVQAMPGILDVLALLRLRVQQQGDVELGMLTGNYTGAVPVKLRAVGIEPEWFTLTAFGDEAWTRPDLVALAMRKYEERYRTPISCQRVIVIGDTPKDIHCAHAHDCIAFAVATGGYTVEQLREAGADHVVRDLSDPTPLLNLITK